MNHFTNSFPPRTSLFCLTCLTVVFTLAVLDARAQRRSDADPYKKISLKAKRPCVVESSGGVTALVRNGVELSVNEDFDCDGVADAYDNCVGMPNPEQTDSNRSGIGDVCEVAATVKIGVPRNGRSNLKAESRKASAADRRSPSSARTRRSGPEHTRPTKSQVRNRKPTTKPKTKA